MKEAGSVLTPEQSVSSIISFFLVMTLYPDVQRKAQAELDLVVGSERLPTFADRDRLPYINAIVSVLAPGAGRSSLTTHYVCSL